MNEMQATNEQITKSTSKVSDIVNTCIEMSVNQLVDGFKTLAEQEKKK